MGKKHVLVVDDEKIMRDSLMEALTRSGYTVTTAEDGNNAKDLLLRSSFQVIVSDIKMPGMSGFELLKFVKDVSPDTVIIMMTAFGTIESAIQTMKEGAFDYLTKPFSFDEIEITLEKAFEHREIVLENKYLRSALEEKFSFDHFIGEDKKMKSVFEVIRKVANSKANVLVSGASGTGKELVARALHYLSPRCHKPFIRLNCAALSSGLLESELFGHEKGAFTGAHCRKLGRFELADGGTLLLDEISEIDISLQAKLLRVLQEREFERVGGVNPIEIDVRVISTTNRDLEKAVRDGSFRDDLYYRLNVVPVKLPPLRERKFDIPILMDFFLEKYAVENNKKIRGFDQKVYEKLQKYDWPGNVRELENMIERAVVLANGELLLEEHFEVGLSPEQRLLNEITEENRSLFLKEDMTLEELEKHFILHTLVRFNGNKTHAADALKISVRTLRNKLDAYQRTEAVMV